MNNYYRNKKLRDSAKHEACVSCGADDGTIVWAHSNSQKHGKGMGIKAHDLFGAYLCNNCHYKFDNGAWNKKDAEIWFRQWWELSMVIACNKGYI